MMNTDPIEQIERELRHVIHDVLSAEFGPDWYSSAEAGLETRWPQTLEKKAEKERAKQKNSTIYDIPMAYSEFTDLRALMIKHRVLFKKVFSNLESMLVYLESAENLRNTIKHHRDISPEQEHLLIGIAGEITDAINLWRIGTKGHVKNVVFTFSDYIATDDKADSEILAEAKQKISELADHSVKSLERSGFAKNKINVVKAEFSCEIKTENITVKIETGPKPNSTSRIDDINCKGIHTNLSYGSDCPIPLNRIITDLGKQYWVMEYHLQEDLDVGALKNWSNRQAGLSPGSSCSTNGIMGSIEYRLLGGKLRVGASRNYDNNGKVTGKLTLIQERPAGLWFPHNIITANHILGFMLGNISPRSIMHLHMKSTKP